MLKYFLLSALLCLSCCLCAQQLRPETDFSQVDSLAMTVKYDDDIVRLTRQLTSPFPEQLFKARAIFRWITDNIAYDSRYYNRYNYKGKEPKTYRCGDDDQDCLIRKHVWESEYLRNVLNNKKAVCGGYAMLFKEMCRIAGIQSEIVPGYVRTEYYQIGTTGELDHAWNAVLLDGTFYLLDATWAAGGCAKDDNGRLLQFHKQFNNYYWLTPPDEFSKEHYPEDPRWVLLHNYTKDDFSSTPYYAPGEVGNIKLLLPRSGIINTRKGDTLRFKLTYAGYLHKLQINTNIFQNPDIWMWEYADKHTKIKVPDTLAINKQQYVNYMQQGNSYEFAYVVKDNSLEYLDLIFDQRRVMRFKVNIFRKSLF